MFSFHKPKVYRSTTGCCICKAKSSSSRFTDSKKYEDDFMECFQLEERRTGEICNACVLLVKRWKKLPAGSNRNWSHVVDARAGPGIKSLTKFKSKNKKKIKDIPERFDKITKKKHIYSKTDNREQSPAINDELMEYYVAEIDSKIPNIEENPANSNDVITNEKQLDLTPENTKENDVNGFIDLSYFKREVICCGTIFKGPYGEVIVDPSFIKPCIGCIARQQRQRQANGLQCSPEHSSASASPVHSSASASPEHNVDSAETTVSKQNNKTFSDSSSDSGYDESSNQGLGESKLAQSIKVDQQLVKNVQPNIIPVTEALRLKTDVPIKQIDQSCKSLSSLSPANVTLDAGMSRSIVTVPANSLIDFTIHTASSRQSVSN